MEDNFLDTENVEPSSGRGKEPLSKRGHKIKWEEGDHKPRTLACGRTVQVRIRFGGQIQSYETGDLKLDIGDWVVVRQGDTSRLGLVTSMPIVWPDLGDGQRAVMLPEDRVVVRLATPEDLTRQAENQLKERDDYAYCLSCVNHLGLSLKLVAVEITLDNFKTIFYYTAEERVDFRQLVRELVSRFRTRIEMRQIGVRQEAQKLGGLGLCGRCFCCSSFLNNFCQVSVKMAKEQNLSLNTAKISGVCGRLMCCLSFENYARNQKALAAPEAKPEPLEGEAAASPLASDALAAPRLEETAGETLNATDAYDQKSPIEEPSYSEPLEVEAALDAENPTSDDDTP